MLEVHNKSKRRTISKRGLLRLLDDAAQDMLPLTRFDAWRRSRGFTYLRDLNHYFPSEIERVVGRLAREGLVEKTNTPDGTRITITEKGKREVFKFDIEKFGVESSKWDGKWRIVFFDIEERKRSKRENLRLFLERLGMWQIQQSVWICPYDIVNKIKYLREIMEIPHEVKYGVLESIENEDELKNKFKLK